jgi:DNA repair protein RadC
MKIHDIAPENRPRERLQKQDAESLSNAELLALILKSGTKNENIIDLCNKLLSKYGLEQLPHASLQQLTTEHGIGQAKASQLIAIFELYKRIPNNKPSQVVRKAADIAKQYLPKTNSLQQEHCYAIYLDTKNNILAEELISKGTLNTSLIHPREVFHGAIKHCANSIILIHNHPSGDPTPSEEDIKITKILQKTGELLNLRFLDHIILGRDKWWSWKEDS